MQPSNTAPSSVVAGRYELEGELARGGMGVVFRARDRVSGRLIALKRSLEDQEGSSHLRTMLQREYQTLVTLRHPNIIQVYDFAVDEHGPYYTMELLDGVDLRAKCPLSWRDACAHLRDVASSLALLHSRRLLHCDVSVANIRLTLEGRAKLLDFGTLASFGRCSMIAGSPPGISPEMLQREELDQRTDLYALGATAYYALTGVHAYPAAMLALLPAAWDQGSPPPPSTLVKGIPRELDELVLALLELDRMSRPASAAEVIDRLEAIAGLTPDQDQRVQRSYLHGAQLVGRDSERNQLGEHLQRALAGRGGVALIVGATGQGKSVVLEDLTQRARLAGARVIVARAHAQSGPFAVWTALLREANQQAGIAQPSLAAQSGDDTAVHRLASTAPLVLAIEDLHEADVDSVAAYAALAKAVRERPVLLLATVDATHPAAAQPVLRGMLDKLPVIELRPFDEAATQAFVEGLFGDVAALPRLSAFLFHHAAGNPRLYTDLIQHLIDEGFIRYAEGTWILPDELPNLGQDGLELSSLIDAAFEGRIARWSASLRRLALLLSPQRRPFDLALCQQLVEDDAELRGKALAPLLKELVREGVLAEAHGSFLFERSHLRELLYARLSVAEKKQQHRRIARALMPEATANPVRGFEVGFHLLLAGEDRKARRRLNRSVEFALVQPDLILMAVPDLWALLEHQRSIGASDEDVQFIEGVLVFAGYYCDPSIHDRLGDRVLTLMHRTLGFPLATRLMRWIGHTPALLVGVLVASLRRLFRKPYLISGASIAESLVIFVSVCAALSAGAGFRLDRQIHGRLLSLLKVAGGLSPFNAFHMAYDLFALCAQSIRGRYPAALAGMEDQLVRLPRVAMFTDDARQQCEAALHFLVARNHLLRLDSKTLEHSERVASMGTNHDRLMAHLLRSKYFLHRGDLTAAKQEEDLFHAMAARHGSRWTADLMAALEFVPYHLTADVLNLKRTLRRCEQLVAIAPGIATCREVVRAMYEGHRGRPDLALSIYAQLDEALTPFSDPSWSLARGHQAECLNTLGQHERALAVCEAARAQLGPEDRAYVFAHQQLERETALALAGLGRIDEAVQLNEALIAECAPFENPLINGLLHFDRARIACLARDCDAFEEHAALAQKAFTYTGNPALIARGRRLLEMARALGLVTVREQVASRLGLVRNVRAERVLEQLVELSGANSACLYLMV
ncbi:MAG TPA: protein kinase, partial [Polyangiales bacterium]